MTLIVGWLDALIMSKIDYIMDRENIEVRIQSTLFSWRGSINVYFEQHNQQESFERLDWRGSSRECEFDEFTSAVLLDFYRLNSHTILTAQQVDTLRKKECTAA